MLGSWNLVCCLPRSKPLSLCQSLPWVIPWDGTRGQCLSLQSSLHWYFHPSFSWVPFALGNWNLVCYLHPDLNLQFSASVALGSCPRPGLGVKKYNRSNLGTFYTRKLNLVCYLCHNLGWGWSDGAKVLCILDYRGVQLILAYSWARPAILVVGKGRGGMFLFLLFLHFHSCSSFFPVPLFHLLYSLFYLFSPFLWETTQNDPQGLTCR